MSKLSDTADKISSEYFRPTTIQRAYYVGRQTNLPLGGIECIAYLRLAKK